MKTRSALAALAVFAMVGSGIVGASPIIRLSDGSTVIEVNDNDANDADGTAGTITYIGAVGEHWMSNMTTGVSGAPSDPRLALTRLDAANVGQTGIALDIWLTDTGFNISSIESLLSVFGYIDGLTGGMVTWALYADDENRAFGTQQLVGSGTNASSDFTGAISGFAGVDGLFSMTLHARINHGNAERTSSFAFEGLAQLVPEPATLFLLGVGLTGLALRRRT